MFIYLKAKILEENDTVYCITYGASQIWKTFPIEIRDSILLKTFNHKIKTWYCNSCPLTAARPTFTTQDLFKCDH